MFIGVDPGAKGAICLLGPSGDVSFSPTPNVTRLKESVEEIFTWLAVGPIPFRVGIEDVHSIYGMSAKSNFQFGRNIGLIECLVHLTSTHPVEYIQPKQWQAGVGIKFEYPSGMSSTAKSNLRKRRVAEVAHSLYPQAELFGKRGGLLDGRSDALMIAHYLKLTYEE